MNVMILRRGRGGGVKDYFNNLPCSNLLRAVPVFYFLSQALMERQRGRLGACIINRLAKADETGHTSHRNDVAMIPLDHVWQELLDGPEVRQSVDLHGQADLLVRLV